MSDLIQQLGGLVLGSKPTMLLCLVTPAAAQAPANPTLAQSLGGLIVGSVPTMLLFLVTLAVYRLLVHAPLSKVLRARYDLTQGAMEKAAAAIAAAEAKTAEYEERMRKARASIFHERHERLHVVHVEVEHALAEAYVGAEEHIATARIAIEDGLQEARLQIDASIDELASEVLRVILPAGNAVPQGSVQ